MGNTRTLIVLTVLVTVVTTFAAQAKNHNVQFRSYLAAGFVGVFLSLIALMSDKLARNFAILILFIAILHNGADAFGYAVNATKLPSAPKNNTPKAA